MELLLLSGHILMMVMVIMLVVQVYKWNGSSWVQRGDDIDGGADSDNVGISVSLSSDGTIVAIGASQISNDNGLVMP